MSYTFNKSPKDRTLCRVIRKTITTQKKNIGLSFAEVAEELGMSNGTLENKLKPAKHDNDLSITEFVHFLELTGDYAALEHIANEFDLVLVPKKDTKSSMGDINLVADLANIENADVFRVVKNAMQDGTISEDEKEEILKEIDEAQKANAILKDTILHLATSKD